MDAEQNYANARGNLNDAIADYIKAAEELGVDNAGIASDVCDSLFDASNGAIKLNPQTEE